MGDIKWITGPGETWARKGGGLRFFPYGKSHGAQSSTSQSHPGQQLYTAKFARGPAGPLLSPPVASWRVGSRPRRGPSKKGWGRGRCRSRQASRKGHAARLRPIWTASGGVEGISGPYARAWTHSPQAGAAPLGPESTRPPFGGQPRPRRCQSAPALPGAPARTHLDVLILVFAFPAVSAGGAAAPHLPNRVFHGERVRVYKTEQAALASASAGPDPAPGTSPHPRSRSPPPLPPPPPPSRAGCERVWRESQRGVSAAEVSH